CGASVNCGVLTSHLHVTRRILILVVFFFFFQAEDGIRDYKVTGVQTCALPISTEIRNAAEIAQGANAAATTSSAASSRSCPSGRSEERRVGKECRWGWWAYE